MCNAVSSEELENLVTDVRIHFEEKKPCSLRDWKVPVSFTLGGRRWRTEWSYFDDVEMLPGDLATRTMHSVINALEAAGFIMEVEVTA